ncbi:hypothetical protein HY967_00825 [Candidatus Jorgensenbacteria bacterium]|nr:hypothetical protein [Candidatus Jorgensenbacteria bacterium]
MKDFNTQKNIRGFTVVELVVAIGVFTVATGLIAGAFIQALRSQQMTNSLMVLNSNMSLVLEQIAREMRTGYNFSLNSVNGSGCTQDFIRKPPYPNITIPRFDSITFIRPRGNGTSTVTYTWNNTTHSIDRSESGEPFEPLTASNVFVDELCFAETENVINSNFPWRILITLAAHPNNRELTQNILHLQTVVSARILPVEAP